MLEQHKLLGRSPGDRKAEDSWVEQMSQTIFKSTPEQAAEAAAAALAEGMSPAALGEAISLAANQLVLRDMGRTPRDEVPGKPIGSVHGDSIGVHACDSANAWRNMARVGNPRNCFASLILGAYQVALDRTARGGDFLNWQPLPLARHLAADQDDRARRRCCARPTRRFAEISRRRPAPWSTATASWATRRSPCLRPAAALRGQRGRRAARREISIARCPRSSPRPVPPSAGVMLVALARVTASEFGRPAPGIAEARALLKA